MINCTFTNLPSNSGVQTDGLAYAYDISTQFTDTKEKNTNIPKICMDIKPYPENSTCDWLQYSIHIQRRELLCTLFHSLTHFGMAEHYSYQTRGKQ